MLEMVAVDSPVTRARAAWVRVPWSRRVSRTRCSLSLRSADCDPGLALSPVARVALVMHRSLAEGPFVVKRLTQCFLCHSFLKARSCRGQPPPGSLRGGAVRGGCRLPACAPTPAKCTAGRGPRVWPCGRVATEPGWPCPWWRGIRGPCGRRPPRPAGSVAPMRTSSLPAETSSKSSPERQRRSSASSRKSAILGRVTVSEPWAFRRCRSKGGTWPEAPPKSTSVPRIFEASRDPSKVSLPMPSYTTSTPRPSVISRTRAGDPVVAQDMVGAGGARQLRLFLRRGGGDDGGPAQLEQLDQQQARRRRRRRRSAPCRPGCTL